MTTHTDAPARATISVDDAAIILGINRNTAYRLAGTGELPTIRLGKRILVPRAALDRMLEGSAA